MGSRYHMNLSATTAKAPGRLLSQAGAKVTKRHLLIAFALAGEWVLAFAFAKKFANALADAHYADAFADAPYPPRQRELQNHLNLLEYDVRDVNRRLRSIEAEHGRLRPTTDD